MKFKRNMKVEHGLQQIDLAPLIDVIFLLLVFFMLSSSFTFQSGINVKLPKAVTSDTVSNEGFTISITGEDVVYFNGKITTVKELEGFLKDATKETLVMIKADRRSSMGRIVDIWDLCRQLGVEKINIATTRE